MPKKCKISFFNKLKMLLWYKRNKTLWDVLILENNQLQGCKSTLHPCF